MVQPHRPQMTNMMLELCVLRS